MTGCTGTRASRTVAPVAPRKPAQPLLPRLLRRLLLSAAVHLLRPAPAGGEAQASQYRRRCRGGRRGGADRRADPCALAAGAHPAARRQRLRPRGADDPPIALRSGPSDTGAPLRGGCEANQVDYLFGLQRNSRLVTEIAAELSSARAEATAKRRPARRFRDFQWATLDSWSCRRRVVGKADWMPGRGADGANPRFVVTSLPRHAIKARR